MQLTLRDRSDIQWSFMVRESNHIPDDGRARLMRELVAAIKAFQDAVDRFDAAAAASLAVNETDLRCLTMLNDRGSCQPSKLAELLGLTRGATTTALNRLHAIGFIERTNNVEDGRSYFVQLTPQARNKLAEVWKPIHIRGGDHLRSYSDSQLRLLVAFMDRSVKLHDECRVLLISGELQLPISPDPGSAL